jgi:hypothetical protein
LVQQEPEGQQGLHDREGRGAQGLIMIKAANFYRLGKGRAVVSIEIIDAGRRTHLCEHAVEGKREARLVAAQYNAEPWNF